jgi:putative tryptophan/tyrosine transport system substrate-binding protein
MMRRREFITLVGGAAAWPLGARAQQAPIRPIVGFVGSTSSDPTRMRSFHRGLAENGYVEGQNIAIEFRWAEGRYDRLNELIADLIRRDVAGIFAQGNHAALAAKAVAGKVPVIFAIGSDPVALGLVASINRPGGNMTGVSFVNTLDEKRFGLLDELVPKAVLTAILVNPAAPDLAARITHAEAAAKALGRRVELFKVADESDFDAVFAAMAERGVRAFLKVTDPFFNTHRLRIISLAARYHLVALYSGREYTEDGGLISYGASIPESYRQAGDYVGKVLKGAAPAEMPILQPTKFELVINLRTAKALGVDVPARLLALADEVIE